MTPDRPYGVVACATAVASRAISAVEVAEEALEAIDRLDPTLAAFTAVDGERVLADARAVDARVAAGDAPRLAGVPVAVKELIAVAGLPASYGTAAVPPRVSAADAAAVVRLREAGALVLGVTRTSELAWRSDTPPTANPRHPDLIPGGSSGGSAAAVAGRLADLALGTDTGGSIRWPATMCGLAGIKPTYGAVSLRGVLPCSYPLDVVGPLAGSVADVRQSLAALVEHDPRDPASAAASLLAPLAERLTESGGAVRPWRLGVVEDPLTAFSDAAAEARFGEVLAALPGIGARLVPVRLPELRYVSPAIAAISLADAHRFAAALRDRPDAFGEKVRRELRLGLALPAALVARAHAARRMIVGLVRTLFRDERLDALVLPTRTARAVSRADREAQPDVDLGTAAFYLASLTGQPAVVVPVGRVGDGAPHAVQLVGRPFGDDLLLDVAAAVEELAAPRGPSEAGAADG
jgi:aspartyl-tRNA(Asn)/glutamyl-tRNA(Gln) amidotransferase subunit A